MSDINIKGEDRFGLTISEVSVQGWLAPFFLGCGVAQHHGWKHMAGADVTSGQPGSREKERQKREEQEEGGGGNWDKIQPYSDLLPPAWPYLPPQHHLLGVLHIQTAR
jgi:hypothetical protein